LQVENVSIDMNTETPEKPKKKWYRIVLKIFLWFIGSIVALALLLVLLLWIFQGKIEQKVIGKINNELNATLTVDDVDVTLFHHFPLVSVVLNDVTLSDATARKEGNLFKAEWLSLEFSIVDVFTGNYTIRQIGMAHGDIWLKVFKDGADNYHIMKPATGADGGEATEFHLERVYFEDMNGGYYDQMNDQQFSFYLHTGEASGSFYESEYLMNIAASMRVAKIYTSGISFVPGSEARIDGVLEVNTDVESVTFKKANLRIADVLLLADGKVEYGVKKELVDITVSSDNTDLKSFVSLFPEDFRDVFKGLTHRGIISIQSHIKGPYSRGKQPAVDVSVQMKNGTMERKANNIRLDNIVLDATFSCEDFSKENTYVLAINSMSAVFDGKPVSGSFKISHFEKPKIKLAAKGDLSLGKVKEWGNWKDVQELSGNIRFDVRYQGTIRSFSNLGPKDFLESKSEGTVHIEKAALQTKQMSRVLGIKTFEAAFSNRDLKIDDLAVTYGSSDFSGDAVLKDIVPYLFTDSAMLRLTADLHSDNVDITELFPEEEQQSSLKTSDKDDHTEIQFVLPDNVKASVKYSADKLSYNKFGASKVKAQVQLGEQKVLAEDVSMKTLGGSISGSGSCVVLENKKVKVSVDAQLKNIDVREAFIVFNNFGQNDMTHDNLRGRTDVSLQMKAVFSDKLEVDPASVTATAEVTINDGELVGYAPINDLEQVIKGRDFSDIQFEKLISTISISDKTIRIPKTEIRSNAMNLKVSGNHTFENVIEYHLEVKFSDVKKQNIKPRAEDEYGYVVDDGVGDPTIFILVTGTVDNPQYKQIDKKAMQEKVKQDLKTEKQNLKKVLNEEFGLFKKDTTLKKVEPAPKDPPKFNVEWEEE